MKLIDANWLEEAVKIILSGICDKLTKDSITVYRVNNIIRVDIKIQ